MANIRQYIGARYVIKIYENSTDPSSAEWEQVNYEPLVMVTWQYGSYLSKKEVPATVGNPASNPDYWVQTGFYNGQIAALQQQIDAINNTTIPSIDAAIQTLTNFVGLNRKVICIGDSYLGGSGIPYAESDSWGAQVRMLLNNGTDTIIKGWGGSGFIGQDSSHTYLLQLQDAASGLTDDEKTNITDILVQGGLNDKVVYAPGSTYTDDDLKNAISSFVSYAHTTFPNAIIRIGIAGWSTDGLSDKPRFSKVINRFKQSANALAANHVQYCCGMENIMPAFKDSEYYDTVHPDVHASEVIARGFINCMLGGGGSVGEDISQENMSFTWENTPTVVAVNANYSIYDNIASLNIGTIWLQYSTPLVAPFLNYVKIGTISGGLPIRASLGVDIPATFSVVYNGNRQAMTGVLRIKNGEVLIRINHTNASGESIDDLLINCASYSDSIFNIC